MTTKGEERWIRRLRKCLREKPPAIRLYTLDGEIVACKDRVSSYDYSETVFPTGIIGAGAMLTDLHDELNNGG